MNTLNHSTILRFQPNIPLLDPEFDAKSSELADFILSHTQDNTEDIYFMEFNRQTR